MRIFETWDEFFVIQTISIALWLCIHNAKNKNLEKENED